MPKQSLGDVLDKLTTLTRKVYFGEEDAIEELNYLIDGLNSLNIMDYTDKAGKFAGQDVLEARANVVAELKKKGLLVSEEEVDQNVGTSDRFKDVVEALPKTQWFVAVNKKIPGRDKSLKELVFEATTIGHDGDENQKINVIPESQFKRHIYRIENLHDWCISRQIW